MCGRYIIGGLRSEKKDELSPTNTLVNNSVQTYKSNVILGVRTHHALAKKKPIQQTNSPVV